jgi:anthranilate synthase component 2
LRSANERLCGIDSYAIPITRLPSCAVKPAMILMLDNYDSFTYNLVQYCGELGQDVEVVRNDAATVAEIEAMCPTHIIISPGPCTPDQAGISMAVVRHFAGRLPLLGVCLGHQSMAQAFGGRIVHAREVMHGKTSPIHHHGAGVFAGIAQPFTATRYHSLVAERASLPACFEITAWTESNGVLDEIMGIQHTALAVHGVQFHPESILTEFGHQLLANFFEVQAHDA